MYVYVYIYICISTSQAGTWRRWPASPRGHFATGDSIHAASAPTTRRPITAATIVACGAAGTTLDDSAPWRSTGKPGVEGKFLGAYMNDLVLT